MVSHKRKISDPTLVDKELNEFQNNTSINNNTKRNKKSPRNQSSKIYSDKDDPKKQSSERSFKHIKTTTNNTHNNNTTTKNNNNNTPSSLESDNNQNPQQPAIITESLPLNHTTNNSIHPNSKNNINNKKHSPTSRRTPENPTTVLNRLPHHNDAPINEPEEIPTDLKDNNEQVHKRGLKTTILNHYLTTTLDQLIKNTQQSE
eukprot:UN33517